MNRPQVFSVVLLALLVFCVMGLQARMPEKNMAGRHRIEMGFGLLSDIDTDNYVATGTTVSNVSIDGPAFSLGYGYWPAEEWSLGVKFVVLGVDANREVTMGQVVEETSTVVPFLFSVGYQPRALAPSPGVRPFLTAGIGSFTGVRSTNRVGFGIVSESRTESVVGGHFGGGVDFLLSRLFTIRASGGYYLVSEFDQPVSGKTDYSSPEFSVSLGFNFGRGR